MFNLINSILCIFVIFIVFIGLCFVQKFLSKKSKMWGIILPALCLIISLVFLIPNIEKTFYISFSMGAFFASLLAFILMNIPTAIFLSIHLYFLKKTKKQSELEKMTIQDLK